MLEKCEKEKGEIEVNFVKEREELIEGYKMEIKGYEIKIISM